MDVMGGVRLEDGTECKVITGIDDHSRFCVIAKLVHRVTARPVCEALVEALERHGVPCFLRRSAKEGGNLSSLDRR
jgi:transposase InsO family protein